MSQHKIILFDLDGTLSDPKIGITKSVQYGLAKMGIHEPDLDKLQCFIGPPLHVSFAEYYGLEEEEIEQAIHWYRERFKDVGMFENELFPEIPGLLQELKDQGKTLVVATSKPTVFAEPILEYFKISHFFDKVVGSHLDGSRTAKTEVIQYAMDSYPSSKREDFIMIGDRKHDMIGANNTGIDSVGVVYGYGTREELEHESPTYIVNTVEELRSILLGRHAAVQ
ncbi:MAG: HAD family hydrolase [Bacillus sp. (in: firmicutes)]